jgi:hypothetical protein
MSALNIEDFQMNQWIFLIDSYGMRREDHKLQQMQMVSPAGKKDHDF